MMFQTEIKINCFANYLHTALLHQRIINPAIKLQPSLGETGTETTDTIQKGRTLLRQHCRKDFCRPCSLKDRIVTQLACLCEAPYETGNSEYGCYMDYMPRCQGRTFCE